jgi:hypothetical protein
LLISNSVFAGLQKMPGISIDNISTSDPQELVPFLTKDDGNLEKYLALEQFFTKDRMSSESAFYSCNALFAKFQFVWYEIVNQTGYEEERRVGGLYRDNAGWKLQLQSFLVSDFATWGALKAIIITNQVSAFWNSTQDSSTEDGKYWTIILMIPASFYDIASPSRDKDPDISFLMSPLEDIFPTLTSIWFQIISKLLREWTDISNYTETFIAGKFTFLQEEKHDSLLFDDDTFSRSRQYFWVITCISEFLPIIRKTLKHYQEVKFWLTQGVSSPETEEKARKYYNQLEAILKRFESQKTRAAALRDGVSLSSDRKFVSLLTTFKLFNASAVVESRLSTRLAQNVKLLTYVSIFYLPLAFCAVSFCWNSKTPLELVTCSHVFRLVADFPLISSSSLSILLVFL